MIGLIAPEARRQARVMPLAAVPVSRNGLPYQPIVAIEPEYSRLPIAVGFNWNEAYAAAEAGEWYLVVFRSRHRADADHAYLTWLDEQASSAASVMPGFLYYFIGTPLADGSCLSFCLWRSREDAVAAAAHPDHRVAMTDGLSCFEHYQIERYRVVKQSGKIVIETLDAEGGGGRGGAVLSL